VIKSPIYSHYTYNGDSAEFYKYSCNRQIFIYAYINIRIKCGGERIYLSVSCTFLGVVQHSCLFPYARICMRLSSVVGIATTLGAGRSEVQIQVGAKRPDRLQDPSNLFFNGYRGFIPEAKRAGYAVNNTNLSSAEVKN